MNNPARQVFPEAAKRVDEGKCATGDHAVGEFRDELSKREYRISGMCQNCQDDVFGT